MLAHVCRCGFVPGEVGLAVLSLVLAVRVSCGAELPQLRIKEVVEVTKYSDLLSYDVFDLMPQL